MTSAPTDGMRTMFGSGVVEGFMPFLKQCPNSYCQCSDEM